MSVDLTTLVREVSVATSARARELWNLRQLVRLSGDRAPRVAISMPARIIDRISKEMEPREDLGFWSDPGRRPERSPLARGTHPR
jgi:hypothetical protein